MNKLHIAALMHWSITMWKIIPTKKTLTPTELVKLAHLQKILADMGKNGAADEDIRNVNVQITEITGESRLSRLQRILICLCGFVVLIFLAWGLYPAIESAKSFFGQTVPLQEYKALEAQLKKEQKMLIKIARLESDNKLLTEEKRKDKCIIRGHEIILTLIDKNGNVMPPQAKGIGGAQLLEQCSKTDSPYLLFLEFK